MSADRAEQTLDLLCQHLIAARAYAVLAVRDGDDLCLHGVANTDVQWPVAEIPELAPLAPHFARILVQSDGYSFGIVCIVDRLSDPSRQLPLSLEELREIAHGCLHHTGKVYGQQMPVSVMLMEIGAGDCVTSHLQGFRSLPKRKKVGVVAWSLDLATGSVWSNAKFNGRLAGRAWIAPIAAAVARGQQPSQPAEEGIGADIGQPLLTYGLAALMAAIFLFQLAAGNFSGLLSPDPQSLVAFGGLYKPAVLEDGHWYRLISAAFLHGGLLHIAMNGLALVFSGILLESWLGRSWLFTSFFLSILGGSAASLAINSPDIVSVGASGAIMGMLATALMVTYRLPYGAERTSSQMRLVYWLIPALIPLATHSVGGEIDFAAHFGGACVGFVLGAILLKSWPRGQRLPRFGGFAKAVAIVGALVCIAALGQAYAERAGIQQQIDLVAQIAADSEFMELQNLQPAEAKDKLEALRQDYPHDPRIYYFLAIIALDSEQTTQAESHLRRGLEATELLGALFPNAQLESGMRELLAILLLDREQEAEAREAIKPLCGRVDPGSYEQLTRAWVEQACR